MLRATVLMMWAMVSAAWMEPAWGEEKRGGPVSEVKLFGDMDCYRVETPAAAYCYGKLGAGFARIVDREGRDWISYQHGQKSKGECRGLPKSGQPKKYFRCGCGDGRAAKISLCRRGRPEISLQAREGQE